MDNRADEERTSPPDLAEGLYRGQFGFRNRGNRTGVDPWDTYMEQGRAEGMFFKALLRLRLRTRNPAALLLMAFGAAIALMPVAFSAAELIGGVPPEQMSLAWFITYPGALLGRLEFGGALLLLTAVGALLLINLALSVGGLFKPAHDQPDEGSSEED